MNSLLMTPKSGEYPFGFLNDTYLRLWRVKRLVLLEGNW